MTFYRLGSGGVIVSGCAGFGLSINYSNAFQAGDRAWIRNKAKSGTVESVVVKKVYVFETEDHGFTYEDTFNRVWLEEELTSRANAESLADSYRKELIARRKAAFGAAACFPIKKEGCG